jgi:hypothetical protein
MAGVVAVTVLADGRCRDRCRLTAISGTDSATSPLAASNPSGQWRTIGTSTIYMPTVVLDSGLTGACAQNDDFGRDRTRRAKISTLC